MRHYTAVICKAGATYNAFFPDVPGCFATSADLATVKTRIETCLRTHLNDMLEDGEALPEPKTLFFDEPLDCDTFIVEQVRVQA
jgi:predicted RNase H-like HicB family nuclease